jgi:hypothetical protein
MQYSSPCYGIHTHHHSLTLSIIPRPEDDTVIDGRIIDGSVIVNVVEAGVLLLSTNETSLALCSSSQPSELLRIQIIGLTMFLVLNKLIFNTV